MEKLEKTNNWPPVSEMLFPHPINETNDNLKGLFEIKSLVRMVGIPAHILGYEYIVEALTHMTTSKEMLFLTEIYRHIANKRHTSLNCVEISIRNAIKKATEFNSPTLQEIFEDSNYKSLSNGVFLNTLKEVILERNMYR